MTEAPETGAPEWVELVWSGPASLSVPVRATAAVIAQVVREAKRELLLMTYSARPYQPLTDALRDAVSREVEVSVVVGTLQGAGSALAGAEPYQAFTGIGGIAHVLLAAFTIFGLMASTAGWSSPARLIPFRASCSVLPGWVWPARGWFRAGHGIVLVRRDVLAIAGRCRRTVRWRSR